MELATVDNRWIVVNLGYNQATSQRLPPRLRHHTIRGEAEAMAAFGSSRVLPSQLIMSLWDVGQSTVLYLAGLQGMSTDLERENRDGPPPRLFNL